MVFPHKLFFTALFAMGLLGCTKANVDVGSLGKLVAAPQLKSGGVLDSDFGEDSGQQKYLRFTGTCDTHITQLQIGFKKAAETDITYFVVPSTSDYFAQPADTQTTHQDNDVDCSDGSFDFILSLSQVRGFFGLSGSDTLSSVDVDSVYLIGITVLGPTAALTMPTHSGEDGDGDGNAVVTSIAVRKNYPDHTATAGECDNLNIYLTDANGRTGTRATATAFSVSALADGTSLPPTMYANRSDCQNGTHALSSPTVPANAQYTEVFVRFASTADVTTTFQATATGLTSFAGYDVTTRGANSRWLDMGDLPYLFYKDQCYAVNLGLRNYDSDKTLDASHASTVSAVYTTTDAKLRFYSDGSCSTFASSLDLPSGMGTRTFWVRYESGGSTSSSFQHIGLTLSAPAVDSLTIDPLHRDIQLDTSTDNKVAAVDFWGPNQISTGTCNRYTLIGRNSRGSVLSADRNITVLLANTASGSFYTDESCTAPAAGTTSASLTQGSYGTAIYYKSLATASGSYSLNTHGSGLKSVEYDIAVALQPVTAYTISFSTLSGAVGFCSPVNFTLYDSSLQIVTPNVPTVIDYYAPYPGMFYLNATCSDTGTGSGSITIPAGQSTSGLLFFKKLTTGSGTAQLTVHATGQPASAGF